MGRNRIYIRAEKFGLLALIPLYFIVVGLMIQPLSDIIPGLWRIIKEPDFLITDYFLVGGIGAAFINAGILTLAAIGTIYFLGMEMDGHTITSSCLMFGFSLFGKNLMNIWAILLGVYLYSKYHKTHMSRYIYIGFYGTSLSPDHYPDHVYHRASIPGQAAIKHPGGDRHRLCAAASGYPCPLCP